MARTNGYAKRFPGSIVWEGKKWEYSLFLTETNQEKPNYTQLDERASWFYEAVGVTVRQLTEQTPGASLTALAILDDLGAIAVIALFYLPARYRRLSWDFSSCASPTGGTNSVRSESVAFTRRTTAKKAQVHPGDFQP